MQNAGFFGLNSMQLYDLVLILALIAVAFFWWHDRGIKQKAYALALHHCQKRDVQLLDQNIRINHISLKFTKDKGFYLLRTFRFEFTHTGERRYLGHLQMQGNRFKHFELQAYQI